jgi:hypothetical protein
MCNVLRKKLAILSLRSYQSVHDVISKLQITNYKLTTSHAPASGRVTKVTSGEACDD